MNIKRTTGIILILISGTLSWSNFIFTGAVVGVSSSLSLIVVLMFLAGIILVFEETLEEKLKKEAEERKTFSKDEVEQKLVDLKIRRPQSKEYIHLKRRLKYMQDYGEQGTNFRGSDIGRYLSVPEERTLSEILLKYLPASLIKRDVEVSIAGSMSRAKKGIRGDVKQKKEQAFSTKGTKSDQFYLSDIDISVGGKDLFNYIRANWPRAIERDGQYKGRRTHRVTSPDLLNQTQINRGYMRDAPAWIKDMFKELDDYRERHGWVGHKKRAISIKFYDDKNLAQDKMRDVLYSKD